jgi:hypothetical protein
LCVRRTRASCRIQNGSETVAARHALEPGGAFVIGVFAEDGPTECSGLAVRRSTADELVDLLGDVEVVAQLRHVHRTPGGIDQPFNWLAGRVRVSAQT